MWNKRQMIIPFIWVIFKKKKTTRLIFTTIICGLKPFRNAVDP